MYVQDIMRVKDELITLKSKGIIGNWELPYENLLTRLSESVFFLSPSNTANEAEIWKTLEKYPNCSYRTNEEKLLSELPYRVSFNAAENSVT
jgi:hypothetical protein